MTSSQISPLNTLNQPPIGSNAVTSHRDTSARQIQHALRAGVSDALGIKGAGHGVRGLAAALQQLLANADPNAPDPVPALLETINTALDTAAKKLSDQGVDQKTIDAAVKKFRSDLADQLDSLAPAAPAAPASTTNAAAIHAVTKEKFTLNILTAEGDRVSIRFRTSTVTDVAAAQTTSDAGTTTAIDTHVITKGKLRIEVQGDLNDGELKAIGDLLDKVDGIAKDFFGGDVQAAFSAAARVGFDSQEISGFNLQLSYSQRIGFASTYAQANTPVVSAPAAPAAPAQTASPGASSGSIPVSAVVPIEDAPIDTPAPADAAPAETSATPVATNSARQTIASFTKDVLAKLASVSDGGELKFTLRWKVDFLLTALSATHPADDTASANTTQALGDALGNGVTPAS